MEKSPHIVCLFSPAALLIRSLNEEYFIKRNLTTLERRLARQSETTDPKKLLHGKKTVKDMIHHKKEEQVLHRQTNPEI